MRWPRLSLTSGLGLSAVLCAAIPSPRAEACDSTACSVAMRYTDGPTTTQQWRVDVSIRQVDQSRRLNGNRAVEQVFRPRVDLDAGFQPAAHEELRETMSFVVIEVSRGLSPSLSLLASLPMRRTTIESLHYSASVAPDVPLPEGHEHGPGSDVGIPSAASNRVSGIGDLQIGMRKTVLAKMERDFIVGLTAKLPTGASDVAGQDGIVDPMLQPGTGAIDLVGSMQYVERFGDTTFSATASLQQASKNSAQYRHGNEAVVAMSASHRLSPRMNGIIQLKLQQAGRHEFRGEPVPSTGLTLVQVVPGARLRLTAGLSAYATMQIPAYMRVNESQLGPRVTLTGGFVKAF
jgi:hypothetical protein